jgi:hypothetical protein
MNTITIAMTWLVMIGVGATVLAYFMDSVKESEGWENEE